MLVPHKKIIIGEKPHISSKISVIVSGTTLVHCPAARPRLTKPITVIIDGQSPTQGAITLSTLISHRVRFCHDSQSSNYS